VSSDNDSADARLPNVYCTTVCGTTSIADVAAREDATRLRKLVEQEKRKGGKKDTSPSERGVDSFKTVS
jgi:hypothetical protein